MKRFRSTFLAALVAAFCPAALVSAQETPLAFTGAQIITISGEPIEQGVLVVHRGKIVAVGPRGTAIPGRDHLRRFDGVQPTAVHIAPVDQIECTGPRRPKYPRPAGHGGASISESSCSQAVFNTCRFGDRRSGVLLRCTRFNPAS